jgi:FkbM family methyltransferase
VAGYARAKPAEGAREEELLREQSERIAAYAAERRWELVQIYADGPGRATDGDPTSGLTALMGDLETLDKVIIVSLDRFAAGPQVGIERVRDLRSRGIEIVSLDEEFDTGEPTGRAAIAVLRIAREWHRRSERRAGWAPEMLRKPGFDPATVIDVGVANGTPSLYAAFPSAHFVLIEPLEEFRAELEDYAARLGADYLPCAAGARDGTATLHVNAYLYSSAIRDRTASTEIVAEREVPLARLDTLREEHGWQPPFGLKIDAEGHEDQVLEGAARLLTETQFVVAEVNVKPLYEGGYSFAELIAQLDRHGFRLCDVMAAPKLPGAHEPDYIDAVFRRGEA